MFINRIQVHLAVATLFVYFCLLVSNIRGMTLPPEMKRVAGPLSAFNRAHHTKHNSMNIEYKIENSNIKTDKIVPIHSVYAKIFYPVITSLDDSLSISSSRSASSQSTSRKPLVSEDDYPKKIVKRSLEKHSKIFNDRNALLKNIIKTEASSSSRKEHTSTFANIVKLRSNQRILSYDNKKFEYGFIGSKSIIPSDYFRIGSVSNVSDGQVYIKNVLFGEYICAVGNLTVPKRNLSSNCIWLERKANKFYFQYNLNIDPKMVLTFSFEKLRLSSSPTTGKHHFQKQFYTSSQFNKALEDFLSIHATIKTNATSKVARSSSSPTYLLNKMASNGNHTMIAIGSNNSFSEWHNIGERIFQNELRQYPENECIIQRNCKTNRSFYSNSVSASASSEFPLTNLSTIQVNPLFVLPDNLTLSLSERLRRRHFRKTFTKYNNAYRILKKNKVRHSKKRPGKLTTSR